MNPLAFFLDSTVFLPQAGTPVLAAWYQVLMMLLFALVSFVMIAVILIQRPKGGGLSGAFGGGGGSAQAAFGAKTGDVLTWFTVGCFVVFLTLAMGLNWVIRPTTLEELEKLESAQESGPPASAPATETQTENLPDPATDAAPRTGPTQPRDPDAADPTPPPATNAPVETRGGDS